MLDLADQMNSVILIVDDQSSDREVLQGSVSSFGEVHVAHDGREALQVAGEYRPDLILIDIELPDMNGFALCRAIKTDPKLCDAAVLFVSSHIQCDNQVRALEFGGVGFIQKPINVPVVRAHVRAHLNLRNEAKRLSYYDALTGLPNRQLFTNRAAQAIQQAQSNGSKVALLLLDLDHFKSINDSLGHSVGDAILKCVAERLASSVRPQDTVSRPGGDEFVILLPQVVRLEAIGDLCEQLLRTLASPMQIGEKRYSITTSIGVSIYPEDSIDLEALYSHADAAMYQAKREGRNRSRFFSRTLETSTRARHMLEQHMRSALEQGVFEVFYQPKMDARTGCIRGMEALIRCRQSDGTLLSPGEFIPVAEETGLIVPLGRQVLTQACKDACLLMESGFQVPVSVNISAVQFREDNFFDMIRRGLKDSGLPAYLLELEITEGVLADNVVKARETLEALKRMGVRLAIDDFGTGYSSLSYLKQLPIDVLKIDQSFVRDMLDDHSDAAIIEAIVRMGQALGLELIAEGVENQEQAISLMALGCWLMQGYHYCRPVPFLQLQQMLETGNLRPI
ncbi:MULTISPECIES: EAL domain-containing response regulator [unclassified Pseudomonas]|uniref:putative bifunctional diguanylate cyclase/phosphodiesterase n=1 Tax=unclassified Pseudomonas TaxID=196821 RepID=UPI001AE71D5D|nr:MULTISPECIES: EAL domain-containing response regulator [unclassified Pseudomonas]MBP2273573.1 diguanylate cyclase (GGDEF)-like protein [Pseudomonas sp. BP6]MBP2287456.1 diguanylate cyclase (GGDEF)-like protein [Pseudomonas sp. BP7]HDS1696761.1 EAL domain-containing protein [Pseudomonas putida]HDS1701880.1 EAL domain-containing protein [Pseudomonas putida]